jgi:predicted transcriptional regulator
MAKNEQIVDADGLSEKLDDSEQPSPIKSLTYHLTEKKDFDRLVKLGKALHIEDRVKILKLINEKPMSLLELTNEMHLPLSSVSNHVNALADASLIYIAYQPSPKGHIKICHKAVNISSIYFDEADPVIPKDTISFEMPVGLFSDCNVVAPCGMAGKTRILIPVDSPNLFFSPERKDAELLWFSYGFVSYNFPCSNVDFSKIHSISFSLELCSEAVYYRTIWPSDITLEINNVEITTITSPGDFGGRRGIYTPQYWETNSTQFGLLKAFNVTDEGIFVNGIKVNEAITIKNLELGKYSSIRLTIKVKKDAAHRGGINIFGRNFGDYPQAIVMTIE